MRYIRKDAEGNTVFQIAVNDIPFFVEQNPDHDDSPMLKRIYEIEDEKKLLGTNRTE